MPNEFASFTPTQLTGTAGWIDFWNADLWWGQSDVARLDDQVQFRKERTTYSDGIEVDNPNGVIQASFQMPASGYFLGTVKLSSQPNDRYAPISIRIDTTDAGTFWVTGDGMEIPVVANLSAGSHRISVIQWRSIWGWFPVQAHLWFHSITCFEV